MTRACLAQKWRERLDDFAESEMTVKEWCRFHRYSTHQYYYWRRRIAAADAKPQPKGGWLAVNVVDTPPVHTAPGGVTVRIAGAAIELNPDFDPAMLRAVVKALS